MNAKNELTSAAQSAVAKSGLRPSARIIGVSVGALRSLLDARDISISNAQRLANALGLEFYIGPPRPPASSLFNPRLNKDAPPPDSALAPVADRDLAEILALLADEYEALNDHGRRQLAARFRAAFPELRGGAPLRRVIRYLGWDVIEAPAGRQQRGDKNE